MLTSLESFYLVGSLSDCHPKYLELFLTFFFLSFIYSFTHHKCMYLYTSNLLIF